MVCGVKLSSVPPKPPTLEELQQTVNSMSQELDRLSVAHTRLRKTEVGVPDSPSDPPLRRQLAEAAEFSLGVARKQKEDHDLIDGRLKVLAEDIAALDEKQKKGQPDWFQVKDYETARKWIADVSEWLTAVVHRGRGVKLPECWLWHPAAVSDLLALHSYYVWAYKQSNPSGALQLWGQWWERLEPSAHFASCYDGTNGLFHSEREKTWTVDLDAALGYIEWWTGGGVHEVGRIVPGLHERS